MRTFGNEEFSSNILKLYPAPLRIVVTLRPDARTVSGFEWTSSSGLPQKIGVGTICSAEVEVERDRPIALFLPWLRKSVGIYD
jgi:HlyD family secretion protein